MSYCFDTMASVFRRKIAPKLDDDNLVMLFEMLIQDMHSANHALADGIDKSVHVSRSTRRLNDYVEGREQK